MDNTKRIILVEMRKYYYWVTTKILIAGKDFKLALFYYIPLKQLQIKTNLIK